MDTLKLETEYITLGQFLKIKDFISSGGEAKYFLTENIVYVNNILENRRGRKLYSNDVVKIKNVEYKII